MNQKDIDWIKNNWDLIPDNFKKDLRPSRYSKKITGIDNFEKHIVVLLLDRQKPSVQSFYDYDQERIGINRDGLVIWGFDSGCSCPSPWDTNYDSEMYSVSKTWKEFEVGIEQFDKDVIKECDETLEKIKSTIKKIK